MSFLNFIAILFILVSLFFSAYFICVLAQWWRAQMEKLNEDYDISKKFRIFALSLVGILACIFIIALCLYYLYSYYPIILAVIILIICLYGWLYSKGSGKTDKSDGNETEKSQSLEYEYQKAQYRQSLMDDIMLDVLKGVASDIGCNVPNSISEIHIPNMQMIDDKNNVYYVYHGEKKDSIALLSEQIIRETPKRLQYKATHLSSTKRYRFRNFPTDSDHFGEPLYGIVVVDAFEQEQYLNIIVTFDTPRYREYMRQQGQQVNTQIKDTVDEVTWDEVQD